MRRDAWTTENDNKLAEIIMKSVEEGNTQQQAFAQAGKELGRSASACGFRWNSSLRKKYDDSIAETKRKKIIQKSEAINRGRIEWTKEMEVQLNALYNKLLSESPDASDRSIYEKIADEMGMSIEAISGKYRNMNRGRMKPTIASTSVNYSASFRMTMGVGEMSKTVEAYGLNQAEVFALLKEIVISELQLAVTYNPNEPVTVNYPTNRENLLEPQEKKQDEQTEDRTPFAPKGTEVICIVNCPSCEIEQYDKKVIIGHNLFCTYCNAQLMYEPHVQGLFKATKIMRKKSY